LAAIIAGEVGFREIAGTAGAFRDVFAGEFQMNCRSAGNERKRKWVKSQFNEIGLHDPE